MTGNQRLKAVVSQYLSFMARFESSTKELVAYPSITKVGVLRLINRGEIPHPRSGGETGSTGSVINK
jgi:hypothetical protein